MNWKKRESCKMRDLRFLPSKEDLLPLGKGCAIALVLGLLFYDSFLAVLLLTPLALLYVRKERRVRKQNRIRTTGFQFKDMILSMAASQRAGYSVENAVLEAGRDMALLHGKNSIICREIALMAKGLANNRTLEDLFGDFAERSLHPDIREFADVIGLAKRGSGNLTGVIADTASIMAERIETERKIMVMIAAKKTEARLMEAVPLFIIFYVGFTNPGFFDPLYHNVFGIVFMTVALLVYLAAYRMIERMIDIRL